MTSLADDRCNPCFGDGHWTRRGVAAALAALSFGGVGPARASRVPRIIALDWGVAETLVALGHPPVGAAEVAAYDRTVVAAPMPAGVVDVGLRLSPNPELMQSLRPDVILLNTAQTYMRPMLAPFGRSEVVPIYTAAGQPLRLANEAAVTLARLVGDPAAAGALQTAASTIMKEARAKLAGAEKRPVLVIEFIDARHVVVYGRASLFQGVFDDIGLENAWTGASNDWGSALAGIEQLASIPEARVVHLTPVPAAAKRTIAESPLWQRLPFVRAGRVAALPPVWAFGGLPSAMRIAQLLGEVLAHPAGARG